MPIECNIDIAIVDQDEFHHIDRSVMRHTFDIHNSMGRFCDERIYQDELADRCQMAGLEAHREIEIQLSHESFTKSYFSDMLIGRAVIYELKAVESLAPAHHNQLINYLLLTETKHGKLINFRSSSIQSRFVSTTLTRHDRRMVRFNTDSGENDDSLFIHLENVLLNIIDDWGVGFDINAYREALLHFTSGPACGLLPVPISSHGRVVGFQKMCLIAPDSAWHLSAVKSNLASHEKHIRRLLTHTKLDRLYWINLTQKEILLRSIKNDSVKK